jgi:hypothetical protein
MDFLTRRLAASFAFMTRERILWLLLAGWLSIYGLAHAAQNAEDSLEYSVKAAFLFKFGGFVEWPPHTLVSTEAPFVIGVLGDDPFGPLLDQIVGGHTIQGRPVVLKRWSRPDQIGAAHILFISQSERGRLPTIVASLQEKNVLTVADFDQPGIIIVFVIENNRVRFEINLDQAERSGLKISSKLLNVARVVRGR